MHAGDQASIRVAEHTRAGIALGKSQLFQDAGVFTMPAVCRGLCSIHVGSEQPTRALSPPRILMRQLHIYWIDLGVLPCIEVGSRDVDNAHLRAHF